MFEILLVEDSIDFQELVLILLSPIAKVTAVPSMSRALEEIANKEFDLFLLDVMLEDGDGFSLAEMLKRKLGTEDLPVIFLTSKSETKDRVTGFKLGAEDYIVKPLDMAEFRVRIEARLQKLAGRKRLKDLVLGNIRLDVPMQRAFSMRDNRNLELTPLQFKLLFYLMSHEGQTISRDNLINEIWGQGVHVSRSVDTHINSLRKKLGSDATCIQSVYGAGYLFSPGAAQ